MFFLKKYAIAYYIYVTLVVFSLSLEVVVEEIEIKTHWATHGVVNHDRRIGSWRLSYQEFL
jgi:hypothetical protein